jgi:RNA polymerase sigma-70 factor (ECF subfamily)
MKLRPEHAAAKDDIDADLLLRSAAGDLDAFDALVTRNRRWVLGLTYRYIGDASEAEDLSQEAFVRLFLSRQSYRPTARFSTFLQRIVVNLCLNEARRRRRRPVEPLEQGKRRLAAPGGDPGLQAAQGELTQQVMAALRQLPDAQRMAVVLNRYGDLSYREIAETMDCTLKSVEALLYRAKQSLLEQLKDYVTPAD